MVDVIALSWAQSTDDMVTAEYGNDGHWLAIVWDGNQATLALLDRLGNDIGKEVAYLSIDDAKAAAVDHARKALESLGDDCRCRYCGAEVNDSDCLVCAKCGK